jgi:hypothetical protein
LGACFVRPNGLSCGDLSCTSARPVSCDRTKGELTLSEFIANYNKSDWYSVSKAPRKLLGARHMLELGAPLECWGHDSAVVALPHDWPSHLLPSSAADDAALMPFLSCGGYTDNMETALIWMSSGGTTSAS